MKGPLAGLVAMAFVAASSAASLAQANKEVAPGAVTSGSTMMALPAGGHYVQGGQVHQSRAMTSQPQSLKPRADTGVAEPNGRTTETGRVN
jgi:hypothetical protein